MGVHAQNPQDPAGFAQVAPHDLFEIGNAAAPPVLYRFRGNQLYAREQLDGSNKTLFSKQLRSRLHDAGIIVVLPVICERDFFQGGNPARQEFLASID